MEALKAQIEDERSLAPAQAGSGGAFCPALLTPDPSSREMQEENILSPFLLNLTHQTSGPWPFLAAFPKGERCSYC